MNRPLRLRWRRHARAPTRDRGAQRERCAGGRPGWLSPAPMLTTCRARSAAVGGSLCRLEAGRYARRCSRGRCPSSKRPEPPLASRRLERFLHHVPELEWVLLRHAERRAEDPVTPASLSGAGVTQGQGWHLVRVRRERSSVSIGARWSSAAGAPRSGNRPLESWRMRARRARRRPVRSRVPRGRADQPCLCTKGGVLRGCARRPPRHPSCMEAVAQTPWNTLLPQWWDGSADIAPL
jgi:hypothetical protein